MRRLHSVVIGPKTIGSQLQKYNNSSNNKALGEKAEEKNAKLALLLLQLLFRVAFGSETNKSNNNVTNGAKIAPFSKKRRKGNGQKKSQTKKKGQTHTHTSSKRKKEKHRASKNKNTHKDRQGGNNNKHATSAAAKRTRERERERESASERASKRERELERIGQRSRRPLRYVLLRFMRPFAAHCHPPPTTPPYPL